MGLLFKTSLVHIGKSAFVVSVLSFFVSVGVLVVASSDNLSTNLRKGFNEIEHDGNPHGLILSVKGFKPGQSLGANPEYGSDLRTLEMKPVWSYRWSWESLKDEFWVKTTNYSTLSEDGSQPKDNSKKFQKLGPLIFSITDDYIPQNPLTCATSSSFLSNEDGNMTLEDWNNAAVEYKQLPDFDRHYWKTCPDGFSALYYHRRFETLLEKMEQHYNQRIKDNYDSSLNDEETAELHRVTNSLNPKSFWITKKQGVDVFMNLWEKDAYFEFDRDFKAMFKHRDVSKKFKELIQEMKKTNIYYQLKDSLRRRVDAYSNELRFQKMPIRFWMTSISRGLGSVNISLPMVPGLTYQETLFILLKLMMWDYLDGTKQLNNFFKGSENQVEEAKTSINTLLEKFTSSVKGIEGHKPLSSPSQKDKDAKKPDDAAQYVLSTVRASKKISELKNVTLKEDVEYTNGKTLPYQDSDTLAEALKKTLKKWIENKTSENEIIPSFKRESFKNYSQETTKDNNAFLRHYQTNPDDFSEAFSKMKEAIRNSFEQYLGALDIKHLKIAKQFLNDSGIFTLSFLLQNFNYVPDYDQRRKKATGFQLPNVGQLPDASIVLTSDRKPTNFFPSLNYHQSIVVENNNICARLDDPCQKKGETPAKTQGHSFKVITRTRSDGSHVNRLKILAGNPLYSNTEDLFDTLVNFDHRNLHRMKRFVNVIRRMKSSDPDFLRAFDRLYRYMSSTKDEHWLDGLWIDESWTKRSMTRLLSDMVYSDRAKQGSRVSLNIDASEALMFTRTLGIRVEAFFPKSLYMEQFSSYFTVVSPFYAQQNNIRPISDADYLRFREIVEGSDTTQEQWDKEYANFILNPKNHDHIINVGGNRLIVVGIGLSPDMIFPSHSYLNLIPNKSKEGLLYVDTHGYDHIKSNSLSVWDEQYLSISYPPNIAESDFEYDYRNQMKEYVGKYLAGGENLFDLYPVKEAPMFEQLVFLRSQYADRFQEATYLIVGLLMSFMGIVILFTVWVLVKRYIISSLKTYGVFIANGIYRKKLILYSATFILIPAIFGSVIGYLAAIFLQPIVFGMISSVWYLSPIYTGFSPSALLYYVLGVSSLLAPISWITAYFLLRSDVSVLMKVNSVFKQNKLVKFVSRHCRALSSLWKFRISVIMNTMGRAMVLSSETILLFIFINFLFNNLNKFQNISDLELKTKNYEFGISYSSPSSQTSMPLLSSYSNIGDTYYDATEHKRDIFIHKNNKWEKKTLSFDKDNPETIGSGLKYLYTPEATKEYLKCADFDNGNKWYSDLGKMVNLDYLPTTLDDRQTYVKYLVSRKIEASGKTTDYCKDWASLSSKSKPLEFVKQSKESDSIWYSSKDTESKTHFTPNTSPENQLTSLASYVPLDNEDRNPSSDNRYKMIKFKDSEPLFKPLIEYYQKKSNGKNENSQDTEKLKDDEVQLKGDYVVFKEGQKEHKHPTLSNLYKNHSNYWLLTISDIEDFKYNPSILKNRVILAFLMNHEWSLILAGKSITLNPWIQFSDFLTQYSPELVAAIETNYYNFVNEVIKSRYGAFFVNRFMTKHEVQQLPQNHTPGKHFQRKPTWFVKKEMLQEQDKLKEEGLYWIDPSKLIYLHDFMSYENRFIIFRPDFLYLFYALMKDPHFQTKDISPVKVSFHQNLYSPDYSNPFKEWQIKGDPKEDQAQNLGLTASHGSPKYEKCTTEEGGICGDQTYTYIDARVPGNPSKMYILGLKQDSRGSYVQLWREGKLINHLLYREKDKDGAYPVVINEYTAKKNDLSVGSTMTVTYYNGADRFINRYAGKPSAKRVKLRVKGIYESYYNFSIYLSQKNANEILGLNPEYGYNGIFTFRDPNPQDDLSHAANLPFQMAKGVSGHSISDIYAFTNMNPNSPTSLQFLSSNSSVGLKHVDSSSPFRYPTNGSMIQMHLGASSDKTKSNEDFLEQWGSIYASGFPFGPSIVRLENANLSNNFIFGTLSDLMVSVINLFITIFAPLLIFSLLVITNLIIEDLRNLLTILSLLGFTYTENSVTILLYLSLVLIFSATVALPLTSFILGAYAGGMLDTLHIYLSIYLRFDYALASLAIMLSMFAFSFLVAMKKSKSLYLPQEMKCLG